jgi:hypothetical protein
VQFSPQIDEACSVALYDAGLAVAGDGAIDAFGLRVLVGDVLQLLHLRRGNDERQAGDLTGHVNGRLPNRALWPFNFMVMRQESHLLPAAEDILIFLVKI